MLAVCNGKASMYETDLFTDLIAAQPPVAKRRCTAGAARAPEHHRRSRARGDILDQRRHLSVEHRSRLRVAFLDSPRHSQRPAARLSDGFLTELVPAVVRSLAPGYPELRENVTRIVQTLRGEEETFDRTLERGMAMLDGLIDEANDNCTRLISGDDAFTLHDTYGFPIELTREIAAEGGVAVDTVEFETEMKEQRQRARADAESKRAVVTLAELPAVRRSSPATTASKPTARSSRFCGTISPSSRCARASTAS